MSEQVKVLSYLSSLNLFCVNTFGYEPVRPLHLERERVGEGGWFDC